MCWTFNVVKTSMPASISSGHQDSAWHSDIPDAVRQLVNDDEGRPPFEKSVDIHLLNHMALIFDSFARNYLKPAKLFFGILPPVRFDQTYHDVDAVVASELRRP
jgi:hypothetical protein